MKTTLATIKAFIRKNDGNLLIKCRASFDGMIDGLEWNKDAAFHPVIKTDLHTRNTLGIQGAWFVRGSRDRFTPFSADNLTGFNISNSCGYFSIAKRTEELKA